jgi:hypothetical protein
MIVFYCNICIRGMTFCRRDAMRGERAVAVSLFAALRLAWRDACPAAAIASAPPTS